MNFSYICSECGKEYDITPELMLCPHCSELKRADEPLRGILEVKLSGKAETPLNISNLLPVEEEYFPTIPVGNTPLWVPKIVREKTGFNNLYIKDDSLNPTGSLKDRASYLVAAFAAKYGIKSIAVASTGNAGSSMAGVGAAAGLEVKLFLPDTVPEAKLVQALQYGADVVKVNGNYDRAYEFSLEYSLEHGGMSRNTGYNPMTIEGKKTAALEIFKQLGRAPDYIFIPVGDGVILSGVYKGFQDLKELGFIKEVPVIYGVQSQWSSALYRALNSGGFEKPVESVTIADSISVEVPACGFYACKMLKKYNGKIVLVSDREILDGQKELSSNAGLFSEPAAAAAYAGFIKYSGSLPKESTIVLLITGSGLKDIKSAGRDL